MTDFRLTALGLINALGSGVTEILPRLMRGDQERLSVDSVSVPGRTLRVGKVRQTLPVPGPEFASIDSRNSRLLLAAFEQIRVETERAKAEYGAHRIGVVLGSSTSGIGSAESALCSVENEELSPPNYRYGQQEIGAVAEFLAFASGVEGPAYTISTACSSSAKVFACGRNLLAAGVCDAVLIGGADSLCRLTLNGFSSLELLSDDPCNPMSLNRKGITIGEGAAVFLMERKSGGVQLLGVGESSDAYHMSSPHPEAVGAIDAITKALRQAGRNPDQIAYVNLHGTGTIHNDAMESKAIHNVFGKRVRASSTKPMVGHMLGASGATEVGFLWMILSQPSSERLLPPHCWDGLVDESLCPIGLVTKGEGLPESRDSCDLMSTSFGFGGSNCAVVVGLS